MKKWAKSSNPICYKYEWERLQLIMFLFSYLKGVSIVSSTFFAFIRVLSVSYFIYF